METGLKLSHFPARYEKKGFYLIFRQFIENFFFLARHEEKGLAACEHLKKQGLHAPKFYQLDITDRKQIMEFRQHLQKTYGGIDILINNASVPHKVDVFPLR